MAVFVETKRSLGAEEKPYSRTATTPDDGIAQVSAKNAALLAPTAGLEPATRRLTESHDGAQSEGLREVAPDEWVTGAEYNAACFRLRQDDSSGNVTEKRAERTDPGDPAEPAARSQVAPEVGARDAAPTTSDEALRLAIKLAVDAGEYERAAGLLEVAKRMTKPGKVVPIGSVRERK